MLRRIALALLLLLGTAAGLRAQSQASNVGNTQLVRFTGAPSGTCVQNQEAINNATNDFYICNTSGAWVFVGAGSGPTAPGGNSGEVQYNAAATFGGIPSMLGNQTDCDGFGSDCKVLVNLATGGGGIPYIWSTRMTGGPAGNYMTWAASEAATNTQVQQFWDAWDGTNYATMTLNSLTGFLATPSLTSRVHIFPQITGGVTIPTTSIVEHAPPGGVTSYEVFKPPVGGQGTLVQRLEAGPTVTQGFSGDAQHSKVVVIGSGTSIGSTELCGSGICTPGTYRVNAYLDITTACTISGTYLASLIYTDDQGAKTVPINLSGTGTVPATGVITTTSTANFGQTAQILRLTSGAINYSTTAVACGGGGPMVGNLYLSVEPVQ